MTSRLLALLALFGFALAALGVTYSLSFVTALSLPFIGFGVSQGVHRMLKARFPQPRQELV